MMRVSQIAFENLSYTYACLQYLILDDRQNARQKILVNGSPKTGTTWMRRLLTSIPGYQYVGNFKGDLTQYLTVQPGQVIHGHDWYSRELIHYLETNPIKVILMVRDPRDQTVSHLFHLLRDTEHPWHTPICAMPQEEALMACIEGRPGNPDLPGINDFLGLTRSWQRGDPDAILIRYEDLQVQPFDQLQAVLRYLGLRLRPNLVRAIIQRNRFERLTTGRKFWKAGRHPGQENASSHYRKGIIGDWRNYFLDQHKVRFKELAGQSLIDMGYETDFDW